MSKFVVVISDCSYQPSQDDNYENRCYHTIYDTGTTLARPGSLHSNIYHTHHTLHVVCHTRLMDNRIRADV